MKQEDKGSTTYVVLICMVAALGGLLFGYDTAVIAGAIGFLQEHFQLSPAMQGWAASCALLGCVIGVSFAGVFSDKWGRKKTLVLSGLLFLASAIGTAVPNDFTTFVVFRILGGVGVGIASMASPMFIAEVAPARMRGRMVSVNQFAIVSGMLIIYMVNYFIAGHGNVDWNRTMAWRWMFASGIVPSVLFLGLLMLVPESPRWLMENNQDVKARDILKRINGSIAGEAELQAIRMALTEEPGTLAQLFKPGLRTALWIGLSLAILQQITGINVFLYYAPEIFKKMGLGVDAALLQTIVVGGVNMLFTVIAIWTVDILGRKPLMIIGSLGMGLCLLAMGAAVQTGAIASWVLVFVLGYIGCFALSVGPVTWVILSEIFPTSIRGRALSIATFSLWLSNFVVSQTFPMMNENATLIRIFNRAFPFYIYAFFCLILLILVWKVVPETKGRTLEDIEGSWTK